MTMAADTGKVEDRECTLCGSVVQHRETQHFPGGLHWRRVKHTAPCGLPCLGGGVGSEVMGPARAAGKRFLHEYVHGAIGGPCTACGFVAPDTATFRCNP